MKISAFGQSDLGKRRQQNEDCFLVDSKNELFAVADGVGGQPAGEIASRLAIDQLLHYYEFGISHLTSLKVLLNTLTLFLKNSCKIQALHYQDLISLS